ncbi:MAG TPA: nucleotide exchange factor GrpE [Thermomicrobiales bacterium]|nr:nucleotide exchange factor GrpE [Thermomicrobiales bacterium]
MVEDVERSVVGPDEVAPAGGEPSELDQLRAESAELLDTLQRSRAEFANYRRRVEQERELSRQRATEDIVRKLLPIADDFERALKSVPDEIAGDAWFEGIRLVERKLWHVLSSEGVEPMESVGQPFDPTRHDAVMVDESADRADTVVEEFQRGYLVNDAVLRPAMVKVGSNPNGAGSGPHA